MLWKTDDVILPYNKTLAIQRLESLEKRFSRKPDLAVKYSEALNKYISQGHAIKLSKEKSSNITNITNFIPHHGVVNPNKQKLRIVFDAAAKFNNISLNDNLLKGPDLLNNLVSVLLRFRKDKYAVTADIENMFPQVNVREIDTDSLRFLWRDNLADEISEYQMLVHIFGKADSPCCANYSLKRTALDQPNIKDSVIESIDRDFYMDDYLKSDASKESLLDLSNDVIRVLSKANFRLRKWISNSQYILDNFQPSECLLSSQKLDDINSNDSNYRTLGILWNIKSDLFKINYSSKDYPESKRGLLGLLCSVFDPIGIVAPCLIEPKLIIQELWRRKIEWDDPLPQDLKIRFNAWKRELDLLN